MKQMFQAITGLAIAAAAMIPSAGHASLIDLQFQNTLAAGPPPVVAYSGAAVLGASGDVWNQIDSPSECSGACAMSNVPLTDSQGNPTSARLSFSNVAYVSFRPVGSYFNGSPYEHLMTDGVYTNAQYVPPPGVFSLSGLVPGAAYDLLLYSASTGTPAFPTQFTVAGESQVVQSTGTTTLTLGDNYARFATFADLSGDISISMIGLLGSGGREFGFLNAIQLAHEAPEPASIALLGTALIGLTVCQRRFRRRSLDR